MENAKKKTSPVNIYGTDKYVVTYVLDGGLRVYVCNTGSHRKQVPKKISALQLESLLGGWGVDVDG